MSDAPVTYIDAEGVARALMGGEAPGVLERVIGFRVATTRIAPAHIMNDLAQSIFGGYPSHRGDLLCRIIRPDKVEPNGEDNRDETLRADERFGARYREAFPARMGAAQIRALREGIGAVLNFDGAMFRAGDSMASPTATHWSLLGKEGFRRFKVGQYISDLVGDEGRGYVRALYEQRRDPVSRMLAPLIYDCGLEPQPQERVSLPRTPFDEALSRGLSNLLRQPLSKPVLLRYLALGSSLGIILRFYGLGREGGRPLLLALPSEAPDNKRRLRDQAVICLDRGLDAFNGALAEALSVDEAWGALCQDPVDKDARPALEIPAAGDHREAARAAIKAMRSHKGTQVYWPEGFFNALGKKIGAIGPKNNNAGWKKYLTLTPELLEVLILMFIDPGGAPMPWRALWQQITEELGVIVGVNRDAERELLEGHQMMFADLNQLEENSEVFLAQAIARGVARRLPDRGAEVGGALT